jgi:hypothetical protein
MKILPAFLLFFLLLNFQSYTQGIIKGRVTDAETKLPLEGASVFAQNTTSGTITTRDGNYALQLNKGGYELVISFTGYTTKSVNVEAKAGEEINVELEKEQKSLEEVIITSTNEVADGWEKYGSFFTDQFIGNTSFSKECILKNPEVLKFYYYKRTDKLKVLATAPLLIVNNSLGYNLRYALDSFIYYYKNDLSSYRGNCFYTLLEGSAEQQMQWKDNRTLAYKGSRLHFLRSYFDSTLSSDGFTLDILSDNNAAKFDALINPYDSSYYFFDDSTANVELWFPKKISITYLKQSPEAKYLQQYRLPKNVKTQISYVDLLDAIVIKPNGYFIDQKSWINQGYWSWKNIADQLPYDYEPD